MEYSREPAVRHRERVIDLQGLACRCLRLRDYLVRGVRTAKQELHLRLRQCGVRLGEIRLKRHGLLEVRHGPGEPFVPPQPHRAAPPEVGVVGRWINAARRGRPALPGRCRSLRLRTRGWPAGRNSQVRGDLLLLGEHPAHVGRVNARPDSSIPCGTNQLHRYGHALSRPGNSRFDHAFDIQLLAHLGDALAGLLVLTGGPARDDVDAVDLRELRRDRLGNTVDEVALPGVTRQVVEREHENGADRITGGGCAAVENPRDAHDRNDCNHEQGHRAPVDDASPSRVDRGWHRDRHRRLLRQVARRRRRQGRLFR